ncbi:3' exoribonuclease family, domain 1 domain-containing protein [Toxoplasma gondii MAS]|uniref:3' exoribonuclease family, domain 1 domain-containing protein n=1 Tax=Toxoplasma gondii MAS TaxID=943118 RepID=A0A086QDI5_TOXGO|nr:3' exoribonuclease family, domain 1 domain-containing protein [Toxoplasma gondii MAS]
MLPFCGVNAETLVQALQKQKLRVDGRGPDHFRRLQISFRQNNGYAEIALGHTRCVSQVTARPFALLPTDRASDGELSFRVSLSPSIPATSAELAGQVALAASLAADSRRRGGKSSELERELERMLRRLLKDSRVVDTEALCIQSGKWAWHVLVAVTVLEDDGNLRDAALLAALCGLMHFKKEAVTVDGETAVLHAAADREPLPLCIHHLPVLVSFAFLPPRTSLLNVSAPKTEGEEEENVSGSSFPSDLRNVHDDDDDDMDYVVDPSALEEATLPGKVSIAVGKQGELCGMYKVGGPVLRFSHLMKLTKLAAAKAKELLSIVQAAVQQEREGQQRRRRTNARSRYDEPSVLLTLPEKHTLPLPSTGLTVPSAPVLPTQPCFSASSPETESPTRPVATLDDSRKSSESSSALPPSPPRLCRSSEPREEGRAHGERVFQGGGNRRSMEQRETNNSIQNSGAEQSGEADLPVHAAVSEGAPATEDPDKKPVQQRELGVNSRLQMGLNGELGDPGEEDLDLSSAISSSFASKVKKLRKSP